MDLPDKVNLTRCDTGVEELALIKTMTREDAKNYIDGQWWEGLGSTLTDPNEEPDRHWRWREILSTYQNKPFFRSKCVWTKDEAIQAAILLRVDALSALDPGERAVFVDRLAAAPKNRHKLMQNPVFRGAGTGLMHHSIALSYSLGYKGRVNLFAVANEEFYTQLGFKPTEYTQNEDVLLELPTTTAMRILKERGLIDG